MIVNHQQYEGHTLDQDICCTPLVSLVSPVWVCNIRATKMSWKRKCTHLWKEYTVGNMKMTQIYESVENGNVECLYVSSFILVFQIWNIQTLPSRKYHIVAGNITLYRPIHSIHLHSCMLLELIILLLKWICLYFISIWNVHEWEVEITNVMCYWLKWEWQLHSICWYFFSLFFLNFSLHFYTRTLLKLP